MNLKSKKSKGKRGMPLKLAAALDYARRGWRVHPLRPKSKTPLLAGWPDKATADRSQVKNWFARRPDANVAIVSGPTSSVVVLDIDPRNGADLETAQRVRGALPETPTVRTGGGGLHMYFLWTGDIDPLAVKDAWQLAPGIELLSGKSVVMPPSLHPETGSRYEWSVGLDEVPIAELPRSWHPDMQSRHKRSAVLPDVIEEGQRNTLLTRLAGAMRRQGANGDEILAALQATNENRCGGEIDDEELRNIAFGMERYPDRSPLEQQLAKLNDTYAVIQVGSKIRVLQERTAADPTSRRERAESLFLQPRELHTKLSNLLVADPRTGKLRQLSEIWMEWPERRTYERLIFAPGSPKQPDAYNLWRGFAVEEDPDGDCSLFLDHLFQNVCKGNPRRYRWVMDWFAQMVQDPMSKPGTALVLRGERGVGKSKVGEIIGALLGNGIHYAAVAKPDQILGRFNALLENKLLVQLEEAVWAGSREAESRIKDLITGDTHTVERKGIDPITIPNYARVLVTSNHDWVVPAGPYERRFTVLDVGDGRRQDQEYFGAMQKQLEEAGGYGKLLHVLRTRQYGRLRVRRVLRTQALREQVIASMDPDDSWLYDVLTEGRIPGLRLMENGEVLVAVSLLHHAYWSHAKMLGRANRSSETRFGMWLNKHFPEQKRGMHKLRERVSDPHSGRRIRTRVRTLPSLAKARSVFGEKIGERNWPNPKADWELPESDEWE